MEFKFGLMGQNMKDGGKIIKLMGKEGSFILMEIFTWENGKTIKLRDTENLLWKMELSTKDK